MRDRQYSTLFEKQLITEYKLKLLGLIPKQNYSVKVFYLESRFQCTLQFMTNNMPSMRESDSLMGKRI